MNLYNLITNAIAGWHVTSSNKYAHVSQFGAKGDGVTNDQPAIQRAIDYCSKNNIPNLHFGNGTYLLSSFASQTHWLPMYPYEFLQFGYTPKLSGNKINITIKGTGNTILHANNDTIPAMYDYGHYTIVGLREHIDTFRMEGMTLMWSGSGRNVIRKNTVTGIDEISYVDELGDEWHAGITLLNDISGIDLVDHPININKIELINNTFIDCHRSITMGHTCSFPGEGVRTVDIYNNRFLYPHGGNRKNQNGNGQVTLFSSDIENLNFVSNYAEGTSVVPVRHWAGLATDGCITGVGINTYIANNTFERFSIETIQGTPNFAGMTMQSPLIIPAVGQQVTLLASSGLGNDRERAKWISLTASNHFKPGSIIANSDGNESGGGVYRVDSYNANTVGILSSLSATMTRLSGAEYGTELTNRLTGSVGSISKSGSVFTSFNIAGRYGCNTKIVDNMFVGGISQIEDWTLPPYNVKFSHDPCVRTDAGNHYLSGNTFYGNGLMLNARIPEPFSHAIVEHNDFYVRNNMGYPALGYKFSPNSTTLSASIIRNNKFHFWVDNVTAAIALTANTLYNYSPIALHANNGDEGNIQVFTDNISYCYQPLLSGLLTKAVDEEYRAPTYNYGKSEDIRTGNTIVNVFPDSTHVSQFGAKGDGVTNDQPAIQRAIDYCSINGVENLEFGSGTYLLSSFASVETWQKAYPSEFLQFGYTPKLIGKPKINLTIKGTGNTILHANNNNLATNQQYAHNTIVGLREHIDTFRMEGMTLMWSGSARNIVINNVLKGIDELGDEWHAGVTLMGDKSSTELVDHPININKIELINNTFIDCHRSITMGHTCGIPGKGVHTVDIYNNRFLYPHGGNSVRNGGSQVTLFSTDIENLNIVGNYGEGSSTTPVDHSARTTTDGFVTFTGINTYIANNTFERFSIETIQATPSFMNLRFEQLLIVPPVGQQITLLATSNLGNEQSRTSWGILTANNLFKPGSILSNNNPDSAGGGIYRIDSYNTNTTGTLSALSATMTRLSGAEYGTEFTTHMTLSVASTSYNTVFAAFDAAKIYGCNTKIVDNIFDGKISQILNNGAALSDTYFANDPCVRTDSGSHYLSGNTFYGNGLMLNGRINDPFSDAIVEHNDFYVRNNAGYPNIDYIWATNSTSLSSSIIRNNRFHFWVDVNGVMALSANPNYDYSPILLHSNNGDEGNDQVFTDNISYCYQPALSGLLTRAVTEKYRNSNYFRNNSNDIVTGNTIVMFPDSINVSQFGAKGDGVTDDRPAIQRAIDYCSDNGIKDLHFDSAVYFLGSTTTGFGTVYRNGSVGYGAGEYLNVGYYPEPTNVIQFSNLYDAPTTYTPINPRKIELNFLGTGSTVLSAVKSTRVTLHGGHCSIMALRENISKVKITGLTFVWDGNLCGTGNFQAHAIIIASNYGGATYGKFAFWPIDRESIDIINCEFINCNRAITSASTILPGRGVDTVNISGCRFLYPKGSDSSATDGGNQVMAFGSDVRYLNVIDNFAEGSTYIPVRSPNNLPKDGFLMNGGINNRIVGNTMERFSIETLYTSTDQPRIYCLSGNTLPPVGGSMTLSAIGVKKIVGGDNYTSVNLLTALQGFAVGEVISFHGTHVLFGTHRIDWYTERASNNMYEIGVTRVVDNDVSRFRTPAVGTMTTTRQTASPLNYYKNLSSETIIIDNIFTAGYSLSTTRSVEHSHCPAVRSDAGNVYLSGNDIPARWAIYAAGQGGLSFTDKWVVEYNNIYNDASVGQGGIASNAYDTTIRHNNFYYWTDFIDNNSLYFDAPKMPSGYQIAVSVNWGDDHIKKKLLSSDSIGRVNVTDNNFYFTYPLSTSKVTLVGGTTHFDTISGNTIINMSPD